jgi:hypothetical protein
MIVYTSFVIIAQPLAAMHSAKITVLVTVRKTEIVYSR